MTVSVLVATVGRATMERALGSVTPELREGDQLMVIAQESLRTRVMAVAPSCTFVPMQPGGDWGHSERNAGAKHATGQYLAFLDDDDVFLPGWRGAMETAMARGKPTIFRMQINTVPPHVLWTDPVLRMGNQGTPCYFLPNEHAKLGTWTKRYGGDFDFINSCKWPKESYVFDPTVIASIRP